MEQITKLDVMIYIVINAPIAIQIIPIFMLIPKSNFLGILYNAISHFIGISMSNKRNYYCGQVIVRNFKNLSFQFAAVQIKKTVITINFHAGEGFRQNFNAFLIQLEIFLVAEFCDSAQHLNRITIPIQAVNSFYQRNRPSFESVAARPSQRSLIKIHRKKIVVLFRFQNSLSFGIEILYNFAAHTVDVMVDKIKIGLFTVVQSDHEQILNFFYHFNYLAFPFLYVLIIP